jgi:hypothetical protein
MRRENTLSNTPGHSESTEENVAERRDYVGLDEAWNKFQILDEVSVSRDAGEHLNAQLYRRGSREAWTCKQTTELETQDWLSRP